MRLERQEKQWNQDRLFENRCGVCLIDQRQESTEIRIEFGLANPFGIRPGLMINGIAMITADVYPSFSADPTGSLPQEIPVPSLIAY